MVLKKVAACAPLALMLTMPTVVSADTLYDNTVNFLGTFANGRETEWGDGVTLAGSNRIITGISLMIHANDGDHPADARVRLFEGGDDGFNPPRAMLWESELFQQINIAEGSHLYNFDVPEVMAPDGLTWTLQLTNVGGSAGGVGPRLMDPPSIGSSQDFVWRRDPNGTWNQFSHHLFINNLGARIEAVPEPASLTLLSFAALGVGRYRRKNSVRSRSTSGGRLGGM